MDRTVVIGAGDNVASMMGDVAAGATVADALGRDDMLNGHELARWTRGVAL